MSMWCEKNHLCEDFSVEIDWEVKLAWSLITFTIRFPILPSDQKTLETREIYRAENLPDTFYDCGGWFDWRKIWELDNGVEVIHPCTSLDLDWIHFQNLAENLSQFHPEKSALALPPKIPGWRPQMASIDLLDGQNKIIRCFQIFR